MDYTLFLVFIGGLWIIVKIVKVFADKSDAETFEEILNDPRVNSKAVGLRSGIKYFQVMKNGKTGFRDLDGKIVIKPIYDSAEMFSEGYFAIEIDGKWGMIDERGNTKIQPSYDFLGSMHDGLIYFRLKDNRKGFMDIHQNIIFEHGYEWTGDFSEGLCVFRNTEGKYGYIDKTGAVVIKPVYNFANTFKDNTAKVHLNGQQLKIDKLGHLIS